MKRFNRVNGVLLLVLFLYGCLPSLRPLYTEDTLIFDDQLIGKWYGEDGGSWSFTKEGEKEYGLRVVDEDGKEAQFEVHLVQIGEHRFIDLFPGDNIDLENTPGMYNCNLVPAHTFMKLDLSEPNLSLQWVHFGDLIRENPEILKHEKRGDDVILITASPEDIQRALIENLDKVLEGDAAVFRKSPVDFSEVGIVFDSKLLGQWESDDEEFLDIIALDNGYDILFSDSKNQQTLRGFLYNLNDRPVMGLYYVADASKKSQPNMDLPPDALVLIECTKHLLKTQHIEWDQVGAFLNDNSNHSFDEVFEPNDVFRRVTER